jgi:uncharacterized Zn-binding protein involved in type VI secretion
MGLPAAKQGDQIVAVDTHIVMVPSADGPQPTPLPHRFDGIMIEGLSPDVRIMGRSAATVESVAINTPPHIPTSPGTAFQRPPSNRGTVIVGSATVRINGRPAARAGDTAMTCNDPVDLPAGKVLAEGTVFIG